MHYFHLTLDIRSKICKIVIVLILAIFRDASVEAKNSFIYAEFWFLCEIFLVLIIGDSLEINNYAMAFDSSLFL